MIVHNIFDTLDRFDAGHGRSGSFYSLPRLERAGLGHVSRLPVSLRFRHGGILLYVLRQLLNERKDVQPSLTERLLTPQEDPLSPFW